MLNPNESPIVYVRGGTWLGAPMPATELTVSSAKDKTVTISAEWHEAAVALMRAVEGVLDECGSRHTDLKEAHGQVLRAGEKKS